MEYGHTLYHAGGLDDLMPSARGHERPHGVLDFIYKKCPEEENPWGQKVDR